MLIGLIPKVLTFAPGVGLLGLAAYQVLTQHDPSSAGQTFLNAIAVFGFGTAVHRTNDAVKGR